MIWSVRLGEADCVWMPPESRSYYLLWSPRSMSLYLGLPDPKVFVLPMSCISITGRPGIYSVGQASLELWSLHFSLSSSWNERSASPGLAYLWAMESIIQTVYAELIDKWKAGARGEAKDWPVTPLCPHRQLLEAPPRSSQAVGRAHI